MATITKIYIVLELAIGGQLFDTIVSDMHIVHSSFSFCYTHHLTVAVSTKLTCFH